MSREFENIQKLLGAEAEILLSHECKTVSKDMLSLPGPDFVDRVVSASDRPIGVLRAMQTLFSHGRLANTGYISILPVEPR